MQKMNEDQLYFDRLIQPIFIHTVIFIFNEFCTLHKLEER